MQLLLGEEADSFSKRAEMYYKRRPEVMTQVEEVYRAYKSLADRYDIMSGELHKANHTIATAFPDQVQYAMLEEEDGNVPKAFTPVDPRKIHKSTVDGLMKKKTKGEHTGRMAHGATTSNASDPIDKENAKEEINRLQKSILVKQTEKEFIKSSYESGIARYWDLEKEINEMQEQVCQVQDKFDESAVIEDDEARALMTATALKSCQDTIVTLQEQRKSSTAQAIRESERVKMLREKINTAMNKHGKSLSDPPDFADIYTKNNHIVEMDDAYRVEEGGIEIQTLIDKIKEHFFEKDSNICMAEITEQIDEVVNKVVDLELMVSSQTSQVNRMCRENNELESSLQRLEEDDETLSSDPAKLNEKVEQIQEELVRVHTLESSFHRDEGTLHSNFVETVRRFSDLSELLQSSACEHNVDSLSKDMLSQEAPATETTKPSVNEYSDVKEEGLEVNDTHASGINLTSSDAKTKEYCDNAEAISLNGSADSNENMVLQSGIEHDKIARDKGSLARLHHISSDNVGGSDGEQMINKEGSSCSIDGITSMAKLQERLTNSLDDKDLLAEYTLLLQDYKDTKIRLTEVVKKNEECQDEIRSLREELVNFARAESESSRNSSRLRSSSICPRPGHRRTPGYSSAHQRRPSLASISKLIRMSSTIQEAALGTGKSNLSANGDGDQGEVNDDLKPPVIPDAVNVSPLEEKFRRDIDTLLEENLEFWMKFTSSLQRVQEFRNKHENLQSIMKKLVINTEEKKKEGDDPSAKVREKELRALKTELQVWSEQNAMLRGELQCRFTSLCDIQEEIAAALDMDSDAHQFTSYQAAKFQGEVLNMQQENNRVSEELQAGLDHVKVLQAEVEQALAKLHGSVSISSQPSMDEQDDDDKHGNLGHVSSNKSKAVPLQSFLFPTKPKRTSLLSRVTPVLQKQQLDMMLRARLPRQQKQLLHMPYNT
jgi:uncharacterized protein YfcZ (UPF0381/DUF406 family)